jgi:hypothetical protein
LARRGDARARAAGHRVLHSRAGGHSQVTLAHRLLWCPACR